LGEAWAYIEDVLAGSRIKNASKGRVISANLFTIELLLTLKGEKLLHIYKSAFKLSSIVPNLPLSIIKQGQRKPLRLKKVKI
jgi:hypothetical protein